MLVTKNTSYFQLTYFFAALLYFLSLWSIFLLNGTGVEVAKPTIAPVFNKADLILFRFFLYSLRGTYLKEEKNDIDLSWTVMNTYYSIIREIKKTFAPLIIFLILIRRDTFVPHNYPYHCNYWNILAMPSVFVASVFIVRCNWRFLYSKGAKHYYANVKKISKPPKHH